MRYPLRWSRSFLRARAGGFRPDVEELEERDAPASFPVTTKADSGGSLRAALNAANGNEQPDIISFAPTLVGQAIGLSSDDTSRRRSPRSERGRAAGNPVSFTEVHHAFPL
jgi:hypothetical protein